MLKPETFTENQFRLFLPVDVWTWRWLCQGHKAKVMAQSLLKWLFQCFSRTVWHCPWSQNRAFFLSEWPVFVLFNLTETEGDFVFTHWSIPQMPAIVCRPTEASRPELLLGLLHECQGSNCPCHHLPSPEVHTGKKLGWRVESGARPGAQEPEHGCRQDPT